MFHLKLHVTVQLGFGIFEELKNVFADCKWLVESGFKNFPDGFKDREFWLHQMFVVQPIWVNYVSRHISDHSTVRACL